MLSTSRDFSPLKVVLLATLALSAWVLDVLTLIIFIRLYFDVDVDHGSSVTFFRCTLFVLIISALAGGASGFISSQSHAYKSANAAAIDGVVPRWLGLLLGLIGLTPLVDAVVSFLNAEESHSSGFAKGSQLMFESTPQLYILTTYMAYAGVTATWQAHPIIVMAAVVGLVNIVVQGALYFRAPLGESFLHRASLVKDPKWTAALAVYLLCDILLRTTAFLMLSSSSSSPLLLLPLPLYWVYHALDIVPYGPGGLPSYLTLTLAGPLTAFMPFGFFTLPESAYPDKESFLSTIACVIFIVGGALLAPRLDGPSSTSESALEAWLLQSEEGSGSWAWWVRLALVGGGALGAAALKVAAYAYVRHARFNTGWAGVTSPGPGDDVFQVQHQGAPRRIDLQYDDDY